MSTTETRVIEYPAEQAGERIGWVAFHDLDAGSPHIGIDVVAASVGPDGARYDADWGLDTQMRFPMREQATGFEAVSGLRIAIPKEGDHKVAASNMQFNFARTDADTHILLHGVAMMMSNKSEEEQRWAENDQDLLETIRSGMAFNGVRRHYPSVYYLLNSLIGHQRHHESSSARDMDVASLLFPDSDMAETTRWQAEFATSVVMNMEAILAEDTSMQRDLTVYGTVPAHEIPDRFISSRRIVAQREANARSNAGNLFTPQFVYLPVGYRPGGRSWPYMDPTVTDEAEAFGAELEALQNKDPRRANHELDLELDEVRPRLDFARQGHHVLKLLHVLENRP